MRDVDFLKSYAIGWLWCLPVSMAALVIAYHPTWTFWHWTSWYVFFAYAIGYIQASLKK